MKTLGLALLLPTFAGFLAVSAFAGFDRVVTPEPIAPPVDELLKGLKSGRNGPTEKPGGPSASYLITVTNDFVVAVYKNGQLIPETSRELLHDRFGATSERINVAVKPGDWLVFNVAHNPVRWGGTKYFAVAGCTAPNEFGFVSELYSGNWSFCDDPAKVGEFIRHPNAGRGSRALPIQNPWAEGDQFIKEFAGADFPGTAIWGRAPSTWIKFAPIESAQREAIQPPAEKPRKALPEPRVNKAEPPKPEKSAGENPGMLDPRRLPVQILSATYGTGGKNADVTEKVREYVEKLRRTFSANPVDLGADPNPGWNKGLRIVYMKDGARREQRRNENETVLPESFYGPQDAAELRAWLPASRWTGPKGEIQFHGDGTFTSLGSEAIHRWEAPSRHALRLTWADQPPLDFHFDYTWSSFSEVENGKNVFHVVK